MQTIQEFIKLGLDRDIPELLHPRQLHKGIELGPGNGSKTVVDTVGLGRPEWEAPGPMPFDDEAIEHIHAYHFFEHLVGADAVTVLRECERVLLPGGQLNIVTPYYNSQMQFQDLDHKSAWNERTWNTLFDNAYYNDNGSPWKLQVHTCFIFGVVERNLALFTQIKKGN